MKKCIKKFSIILILILVVVIVINIFLILKSTYNIKKFKSNINAFFKNRNYHLYFEKDDGMLLEEYGKNGNKIRTIKSKDELLSETYTDGKIVKQILKNEDDENQKKYSFYVSTEWSFSWYDACFDVGIAMDISNLKIKSVIPYEFENEKCLAVTFNELQEGYEIYIDKETYLPIGVRDSKFHLYKCKFENDKTSDSDVAEPDFSKFENE